MTTAYITGFKGRLLDGSTLIVDGAEYPIPALTANGTQHAGDRVRAAAATAGYQIRGELHDAISDVDEHGGYAIELVKL